MSEIFAGRKFCSFTIFWQIAKFNSCEYQDFLQTVKFHSTDFLKFFGQLRKLFSQNSNFANLKILMNGIPIKYNNSLMKVKKLKKLRLNSLLLLRNQFMQNGSLISKITWQHSKGNKLFHMAEVLQGSQMHWKMEKLVWNHWARLLILTH